MGSVGAALNADMLEISYLRGFVLGLFSEKVLGVFGRTIWSPPKRVAGAA